MSRALFLVFGLVLASRTGAADLGDFGSRSAMPPRTDWKETVSDGEEEIFRAFALEINAIQDRTSRETGTPVDRGFHPKQHAVVTAEFTVDDDIPEPYRQGVFAHPGTYAAWVRFSNLVPRRQADKHADFRAMAIKVLDVPGESLTPGSSSLDLLMLNQPIQPARNIHQFISFVRHSSNIYTLPVKLAMAIGIREATRLLWFMARKLGGPARSLAVNTFWSTLPIAFGPYAVKYRFEPKNGEASDIDTGTDDYLRAELTERLRTGPLQWDMYVQFYTDPAYTPIEDAAVEWSPTCSPFLKVGELTISSRDLDSEEARLEETRGNRLLFTPWHAPAEHRPLGNIQRARRVAYPASGNHRGFTQP